MPTSYLDISSDNDEYASSIYTFFDKERYFFNSPEGCQRVIKERTSIKLSKIGGIFITNLSWDTIGGLFGILYILAGIDTVKEVNVYGPRGLYNIFYHARQFFNVTMKTNVFEMNDRISNELPECTSSMNVTSIPIWNSSTSPSPNPSIQEAFEKRVFHNFINPEEWLKMMNEGAPLEELYKHVVKPSTIETDTSGIICYLGKTKPSPGRFYPDKATALGIPRGALFQKLIAGESILSPKTNEMVHPHQVSDPPIPGAKFLIIRCPSVDYFDSLFNQSVFSTYQNNAPEPINIIVHLTPNVVLEDKRYQDFIKKFGSTTKHIIANSENCTKSQSYYIAEKDISCFSHFFPTLFPDQWKSNVPIPLPTANGENIVACSKVTRGTIMPTQSAGKIETIEMHEGLAEDSESKFYDELLAHPKSIELRNKTIAITKQLEETKDESKNVYPRILFTGTSAAKPTKNRGVTGHLIETQKGCYMVMDGGEGTLAQITRFYGREQLKDILFNIRLIWVSHMHADHHLGIPAILEKRYKLAKEFNVVDQLPKVVVICPKDFQMWITALNTLVPIDHLAFCYEESNDVISNCYHDLGIKQLINVQVDHCPDAKGVVMELTNGFKLSFSGDTRPCEEFIRVGKDSDLMIHEATFEDDKIEDSIEKKHSTIGEALKVGKDMNAKWSILTHFSGKTKTTVSIDTKVTGENFGMAFDFLNISPYQYPLLQHLNELQELKQELQQK